MATDALPKHRGWLVVALLTVALLVERHTVLLVAAVAQEQAPPVFRTGADVVRLTVSVRDASGRLVPDLKADDFALYEEGRPQAIQLFAPAMKAGQDQELALDLGLLLDTSASMATQIRLTQEAAFRFLEAIPRARDLITIFFDDDIRISRYDSEHQQGLSQRILETRASGGTALYDAIAACLSRVDDSPGRKVLVILTDGEDSASALSLGQVVELVRSSPVTIYAIAFPGQYAPASSRGLAARAFLRQLAALTGGEVFSPNASKDLSGMYERILEDLSAQYVLGYTSDDARRDGRYRRLRIEVKQKGLKLRHRAGYYASRNR